MKKFPILAAVFVVFSLLSVQVSAEVPQAGAPANADGTKSATTNIFVVLKTSNITAGAVIQELKHQKNWPKLGMEIVQSLDDADQTIEIDRPQFPYVYSFTIVDKLTSKVLGSGKVTAMNASIAPGAVASELVKSLEAEVKQAATGTEKKSHGALHLF